MHMSLWHDPLHWDRCETDFGRARAMDAVPRFWRAQSLDVLS